MSHCAPDMSSGSYLPGSVSQPAEEIVFASRTVEDGLFQTDLSIPSAHCGACMAAIEKTLSQLDGVVSARLNLSTKRASVKWRKDGPVPPLTQALKKAGYEASLASHEDSEADPEIGRLVRATAVAGFAAMNIMLLSVSVWAGADDGTRHAFHLISALIALPAIAYSGRIFFLSAWSVLGSGATNMDVPISVGILLTLALSVYDTFQNGPHAYFDAVTTLTFFLLGGRTLDHMMRRRARTAVMGLAKMMPRGATVRAPDGTLAYKPQEAIAPGEQVLLNPGDRIPLDGVVEAGTADIDAAVVTGEATPVSVKPGSAVLSGMLNLNGSLEIRVTKTAQSSFVSEMIRMMEGAEHGRARYRQIADRAASLYSPVVHTLAAGAFIAWVALTGDFHRSMTVAISVLIITCPCALGLAVPMVQVMAARRLFERGVALKDGSALERLAQIDTVIFDKTGTLTAGDLQVTDCTVTGSDLDAAAALAARSRHPASRAVATLHRSELDPQDFEEHPGQGIEARIGNARYRLGQRNWVTHEAPRRAAAGKVSATFLSKDGVLVGSFEFADSLRPEARETIGILHRKGLRTEVLSGDREEPVSALSASIGIENFHSGLDPHGKVEHLRKLQDQGRKTLMVGDGLNDAPALSAAHVSIAPANAADVGRAAADLVFFGRSLKSVPEALDIARAARHLVHQNLTLAIGYNVLVIPVALAGYVTPLMAAFAMSLSSILVVGNALRFPRPKDRGIAKTARAATPPQLREVAQ